MSRAIYLTPEGEIRTDVNQGEYHLLIGNEEGVLWVDLYGENLEQYQLLLENIFQFHTLSVADALEKTNIPKVDDWGKYLYLVLHENFLDLSLDELISQTELDVFIGPGYLVTHHQEPVQALEEVWESCQRDPRYIKRGSPYLLYQLAAELLDGQLPIFDKIEVMIDELEDQILDEPQPDTLERMFALKRGLLKIRRMMMPQREVFSKLANNEYLVLNKEQRYFFRNIYDHYARLHELTENLRELLMSALEIHLSATNNRMNQVVKTLTTITTMFMPVSFITSFFGMNFFGKEFDLFTPHGLVFFIVMSLSLVAIPIAMYRWMRRRDWM
jgi:magnesium transporter